MLIVYSNDGRTIISSRDIDEFSGLYLLPINGGAAEDAQPCNAAVGLDIDSQMANFTVGCDVEIVMAITVEGGRFQNREPLGG